MSFWQSSWLHYSPNRSIYVPSFGYQVKINTSQKIQLVFLKALQHPVLAGSAGSFCEWEGRNQTQLISNRAGVQSWGNLSPFLSLSPHHIWSWIVAVGSHLLLPQSSMCPGPLLSSPRPHPILEKCRKFWSTHIYLKLDSFCILESIRKNILPLAKICLSVMTLALLHYWSLWICFIKSLSTRELILDGVDKISPCYLTIRHSLV